MNAPIRAPEIDLPGIEWFNAARPLSLEELRGKLVILDFWTFCCINCMHILPILARLEEQFPDELVVVGVHSPKFEAERDSANLRQAIARYGIKHPVAHDPAFQIWQHYAVKAWPTLVFIAPDGSLLGHAPGEPDPDKLIAMVEQIIAQAHAAGDIQRSALPLETELPASGRLCFPAKMKRLTGTEYWALADSGHHQIVILDENGEEFRRIGSGRKGLQDGSIEDAMFDSPQGLACVEQSIYVADTNNHAVRRVDLASGTVETIAGNGNRGPILDGARPARQTALASPWDLAVENDSLYIANAGTHQLAVLDLGGGDVAPLAGTGQESIVDGPALAAQLAQPSGLALDPVARVLYFADSETSSVRKVTLEEPRTVETIVGTGLFDFGDANGPFTEAQLQHPLGLDLVDDALVVADSYNGKLRLLDLRAGTAEDFDDGSFTCTDSLCLPQSEPAGVTVAEDGRIFMVDTNNHRVLVHDTAKRTYRTWVS